MEEITSTTSTTQKEQATMKMSKAYKRSSCSESDRFSSQEVEYRNKVDKLKKCHESVQKIKIGLYLEAMKIHQGTGDASGSAESKFNEYWESFGNFISSSFAQQPGTMMTMGMKKQNHASKTTRALKRSDDNAAFNGIEGILNKFLITKSMRKKHNSLIKALMKLCMCEEVLESHVRQHIPNQWKKRIRKVPKIETSNDSINNNSSSTEKNNNHHKTWGHTFLDIKDIVEYHHDELEYIDNSTPIIVERKVVSKGDKQNNKQQPEQYVCSATTTYSRLPGLLEIDHMSREVLEQTNIIFTSSGLQFVADAVCDLVSQVLKNALLTAEKRETYSHRTTNDHNYGEATTSCSKKRKIKSFDVINSLHSSFKKGANRSASRMIWERSISEINQNNCLESDPQLEETQEEITNLIITTQLHKRQRVEDFADNNTNQATNANIKRCSSRAGSIPGKGKNLAQMVQRRQMDELSKKGLSMTDDESKQDSFIAERISRPPFTIGIEKGVRSNVSPNTTGMEMLFNSGGKPASLAETDLQNGQQHLMNKNLS